MLNKRGVLFILMTSIFLVTLLNTVISTSCYSACTSSGYNSGSCKYTYQPCSGVSIGHVEGCGDNQYCCCTGIAKTTTSTTTTTRTTSTRDLTTTSTTTTTTQRETTTTLLPEEGILDIEVNTQCPWNLDELGYSMCRCVGGACMVGECSYGEYKLYPGQWCTSECTSDFDCYEGECAPESSESRECGICGTQWKFCECTWSPYYNKYVNCRWASWGSCSDPCKETTTIRVTTTRPSTTTTRPTTTSTTTTSTTTVPLYCGDGTVTHGEQCELPNTNDNTYCTQNETTCLGNQSGTRDLYGNCDDQCQCVEDPFIYQCIKDSCGAECGSNDDCGTDGRICKDNVMAYRTYICNGDSCTCSYIDSDEYDCDQEDGWYFIGDWEYLLCKKCRDQEYRDFYCSSGNCSFTVTGIREYCENINEDQVCNLGDYECKDDCNSAQREYTCQLGECEFNQWVNTTSCNPYGCYLGSCSLVCSQLCSAECDSDSDCPDDSCSERYYDYCEGKKLVEYDDDKKKDSTLVSDSVENVCLEDCACTDDQADCSPPSTNEYCVKGLCGASCDSDSHCQPFISDSYCEYGGNCDDQACVCNYDYQEYCPPSGTISDSICYYGTRGCTEDGCTLENCSLESYCIDNVWYYNGRCTGSGCVFNTQDCDDLDYYEQEIICGEGNTRINRTTFHDFSCGSSGCEESITTTEETLEDCDDRDGSQRNECGIEDWSCSEGICNVSNITKDDSVCQDFCDNDERNYNGYCGDDYYCDYTTEDCDLDGSYCVDDTLEYRDYYCTPNECLYSVTDTEDCDTNDGWYNYGNVSGFNDPTCEYRNYFCQDSGLNDYCSYSTTETHDYDNLDGWYCIDSSGRERRDYYCNATGESEYQVASSESCGIDEWSGGGDTPGFGNDPACVFTNYFCVDFEVNDYCSSNTTTEDFDHLDNPNICVDSYAGKLDYWCNATTCDSLVPENGCQPGTTLYTLECSIDCGAECEDDNDCLDSTCEETFYDYCVGYKLVEYDSDKVLDSTTVTNSTPNQCLEDCVCTDDPVTCNPPPTNTYCVQGVCDAQCDSDDDCGTDGWICKDNVKAFRSFSCGLGECACSHEDSNEYDCDQDDGWTDYVCKPGEIWYKEYRDYGCSGGECEYTVTNTESQDCDDLDGWYDAGDWIYHDCKKCKDQEYRDYYCSASGCVYTVTDTREYCENINEGQVCNLGDYECKDDCNSAQREYTCQSGECEFNQWMNLQSCDPYTCSLGSCTLVCSEVCGASCDENIDCPGNSCSETYYDYCEGYRLVEYDDDKVKDSTEVTDSCDNVCQSDCICTDCSVDCSPPDTNTYCVEGVCGAECDSDDDCPEDGFYCSNSYTKQERDYYCSACDCEFDVPSSDDCRDNDVDSDAGKNYTVSGTCTDYTGCLDGECVDDQYTDYCIDDTLVEYYVNGMTCRSVTKDCNDFDSLEMNETEETCDWEDYGCDFDKCSSSGTGSVDCNDYDFLSYDLDQDTCSWADKGVSETTCEVGCVGEDCCYDEDSEDLDCDDYDSVSGNLALDYEVSETTCVMGCHDEECCEPITNKTCDEMCETVIVEGVTYYCDGENWVTEPPYCCFEDREKPTISNFEDDGNMYDDDQTPYTICAEVQDNCPVNVQFSYKFFCYPFSDWFNYTSKIGNKYCYDIPREVWIEMVGRSVFWKVYAEDYSSNSKTSSQQTGGRIYDEDDEGPSFSDADYSRWVNYALPIPVEITITDPNGIDSAILHYDYDYFTGEDGYDSPSVVGDRYTFTIPAPEIDYKTKNLKFWIIATDNDTDRPDDKSTSRFDSQSIYIDPPEEVQSTSDSDHEFQIDSYSPADSNVVVKEGACKSFHVSVSGDELTYVWTLDGKEVSNTDSFIYCPENGEAGSHEVKVEVSEGLANDSHSWSLTVENELCGSELNPEPANSPEDSSNGSGDNNRDVGGGSGEGGGSNGGSVENVPEETETEEEPIVQEKEEIRAKATRVLGNEPTETEPETQEKESSITGLFGLIEPRFIIIAFAISFLLIFFGIGIYKGILK